MSRRVVPAGVQRGAIFHARMVVGATLIATVAIVPALSPSRAEALAHRLLSSSLTTDQLRNDCPSILEEALLGTPFESRWQINGPYADGLVNLYIVDSTRLSESSRAIIRDFEGKCAYAGNDTIFLDTRFIDAYKSNRTLVPMIGADGEDIGVRRDRPLLLRWILGPSLVTC